MIRMPAVFVLGVFGISSVWALGGGPAAGDGVAPRPWLENQASLARAGGWQDIERDALLRLMSLNPDDAGPKLEALRLAIAASNADARHVDELARDVCGTADQEACREARVLAASTRPPLSERLSGARLLMRAGRSAEALQAYQNAFESSGGVPPEDSLALEYMLVLLTIPAREQEGVKGIEALIERAGKRNEALLKKRAESLLARHFFESTLETALDDIYENDGRRERAARVLEKALKSHAQDPRAEHWRRALNDGLFWIGVDRGDMLVRRGRIEEARRAYREAAHFRPDLPYAHLGLAKIARHQGEWQRLRLHLADALRASRNATKSEQRRISKLLAEVDEDELQARQEHYLAESKKAREAGDSGRTLEMLARAVHESRPEPWLISDYSMALLYAGRKEDALTLWKKYSDYLNQPEWALPYARVLMSAGHKDEALRVAERSAASDSQDGWLTIGKKLSAAETLRDLKQSLETITAFEDAEHAAEAEDWERAADILGAARPTESWQIAQLARWQERAGMKSRSAANWDRLSELPQWEREAPLNAAEALLGDAALLDAARKRLSDYLARFDRRIGGKGATCGGLSMAEVNRVGSLLEEAGESERALRLYEDYAACAPVEENEESAMVLRKAAAGLKGTDPSKALTLYRTAFVNAGLLQPGTQSDNRAFTRAMRRTDGAGKTDWLRSSLRSDAEDLYLNETAEVRTGLVWNYDHGTSGYSDLSALTWVKEAKLPMEGGWLTLRADTVHYDVGDLTVEEPYGAKFGTCYAPGCRGASMRRDFGESLAVKWAKGAFAGDLGLTPMGFVYSDVVGGVSYSWDLDSGSITLSAYRRPKSSSLLSFGGMRDPETGRTWGGVRRTGMEISGSYDQGGTDGFWGFVSFESLDGRNVEDNSAIQAMAGWYRRLINEENHERTVGLSLMYWHFERDLSDYVWGQGGYFSPQQFVSVGTSLTEARRSADWSWLAEGRVGLSYSRSSESARYPLKSSMPQVADLSDKESSDSSVGISFSARAAFERRLDDRWFLGGELIYQQSSGYAPVLASLWLRWTLDDWAGDLPLPPEAPAPYSEWK